VGPKRTGARAETRAIKKVTGANAVTDDAPRTMARSSAISPTRRGRTRPPRDPMPTHIDPMLAVLSDLPPDPDNWAFEYKWDGVRALCFHDGKRLTLHS